METGYGDIVIRRLNKAGIVSFSLMGILLVASIVLDVLWASGAISLITIFEPQYQILYFLWFIFVIVCLGIDKVVINEKGFTVSTLFAKKQEIEKTAMVPVIENGNKLFLIPIASSLGLYNPLNFKTLKKVAGVVVISSRYREKMIERGYTITTSL